MALSTNILKEDSLLARYIADTWAAQNLLEEDLNKFKEEIARIDNPVLYKLCENIEYSSNELKQCITNAIKQID